VNGGRLQTEGSLPIPGLLLVAALAAAVAGRGAYYRPGQWVVGLLLAASFAVSLGRGGRRWRALRFRPVLWCVLLATWAVVSALIAHEARSAVATVALLAAVAGVLAVCRRTDRWAREALVTGALAVGAFCALSGWVGVAFRVPPLALEDRGLWRGTSTLTYANATAGLLVPLALVAIGRAVSRPAQGLPNVTISLLLLGIAATLSRGGAVGLVAGVIVLMSLLGPLAVLRAALLPGVGAAIAFAGLMPSIPASTSPRPGIAIAALLVGIGFVAAFSRAASAKTAVAAVLALGALAPAVADDLGTVLSSRFHVASPDRTAERAAALRLFREHPVTGTGPGEATLRWRSSDGEEVGARYAHNEYLQTLAELGVVGVGLLVALMFSLVRALNRTPRRLWAGVVAALLALGVQSVFDFLWHVPALPLVAALLAGAACPSVVENERDEHVDLVSDDLAVTHLDPLLLDPR
jgi:hypothetical protein